MLTVSGHTSWKRAFIQTTHTMPRGANVIFICRILMAMSFHLLVRSSLKSQVPENCTARRSALTLALDLKLFQSLLHHSKGDGNAEHFAVIDPLDFNSPNASMS